MADMDVVLWNKIKSGDKAAFEILFQSYYTILCLFAKRYTHDMNLSKEIVHDLFVYLWEHRDKLSINISIKAYLYRAVRFNSLRRLENEKKLGIRMDIIPEPARQILFYRKVITAAEKAIIIYSMAIF